jgi:hypothetical protein
MSAIAASTFSLAASSKARGLGFRSSAPMGNRGGCAAAAVPIQPSQKHGRGSLQVVAGNKNEGGLFAPAVVISRNIVGVKKFNAFRGKIIALHSQVRENHIPTATPPRERLQTHHRLSLIVFFRERRVDAKKSGASAGN